MEPIQRRLDDQNELAREVEWLKRSVQLSRPDPNFLDCTTTTGAKGK